MAVTDRDALVASLLAGETIAPQGPVLTELDRQSPVWLKLKKHYEARIARLRVQNDKDRDPIQTAKLRGRIAEAHSLLALDSPSPKIEPEYE